MEYYQSKVYGKVSEAEFFLAGAEKERLYRTMYLIQKQDV